MRENERDIRVLLSDIRSIHNVGSIFRTVDGAGISRMYLSGFTPAPIDRFGRNRKDFAKVALGAEGSIKWESVKDSIGLIQELKKEGFQIIALEQHKNSVNYRKIKKTEKMLLIVGNEPDGLSKEILEVADVIAEIPMHGEKESLNVSVAFGVLAYSLQ